MPEVIEVKKEKFTIRARIYQGIGNLRKVTPQGEVMARPGDVLLQLPGGLYVMDQLSAAVLLEEDLDELINPEFEDDDDETGQKVPRQLDMRSQREIEDASSPTWTQEQRDEMGRKALERAKEEEKERDEASDEEKDTIRKAQIETIKADQQNIGGEVRGQSTQSHLRNIGGEVRTMPGPHPGLSDEGGPISQDEKKRIEKENQTFQGGVDFIRNPPVAPQANVPGGGVSPVEESGSSSFPSQSPLSVDQGAKPEYEEKDEKDLTPEERDRRDRARQSTVSASPNRGVPPTAKNPTGHQDESSVPPAFRKPGKR